MLPNLIHLDMFWALTNVPDDKYRGDRSEVVNVAMCPAERTKIVDQHTMCVRCEGSSGPRGVRFAGCVGRQFMSE